MVAGRDWPYRFPPDTRSQSFSNLNVEQQAQVLENVARLALGRQELRHLENPKELYRLYEEFLNEYSIKRPQ